jgi:hypothetical protein
MGFDRRAYLDQQSTVMFLVPLWVGTAILVTVLAATSLVGDRHRGFLDLVLVTQISAREVIDGTLLALWEHLRRSFALVWLVAFYFCLAELPGLVESLCSALTATLFCALLALYGVLCSLVARSTTRALLVTLLFPMLANLRLIATVLPMDSSSGSISCALSGLTWLISWMAFRRRANLGTVICYLLSLYWLLVALASTAAWTLLAPSSHNRLLDMVPVYLIATPLVEAAWKTFTDLPQWRIVYACYWIALVVNFLWARHWTIQHFDKLAGRLTPPKGLVSDDSSATKRQPQEMQSRKYERAKTRTEDVPN